MDIDTPPPRGNKAPKKKEAARRFADIFQQKPLPPALVRQHVLSYLLLNCYRETALAFLSADVPSDDAPPSLSPVQLAQLDARRAMMDAVLVGDILNAIHMADALLGADLATLFPMVHLRLLCQHFVELVRSRRTIDALSFAQQTIAPLGKRKPEGLPLLQSYLPLLAYRDPELSPVFELVDVKRREALAEELNGCVFGYLRHGKRETTSELERLLRQLTLVMRRIGEGAPDWKLGNVFDERPAK